MENPADKDKFPDPSHFLFSSLAGGACRALLGLSYAVDTFLAACPFRGKEKNQDSLAKPICNLVTSYWHLCRGDAKDDGEEMNEWRDQGKAWLYLSPSLGLPCPCWVSEDEL